jgi:hypothetical protein
MLFKLENITNFDLSWEYRQTYIDTFMDRLGFKLLGEGRMRRTFLSPHKRFVLKFPTSAYGLDGNRSEARLYQKFKNRPDTHRYGMVYAPCRLIQDSILMMWAVKEAFGNSDGDREARSGQSDIMFTSADRYNDSRIPRWAVEVDCQQVGILANGRMVAYDYTDC